MLTPKNSLFPFPVRRARPAPAPRPQRAVRSRPRGRGWSVERRGQGGRDPLSERQRAIGAAPALMTAYCALFSRCSMAQHDCVAPSSPTG